MRYKFLHAIVLTHDEFKDYKDIGVNFTFGSLSSGDYIVHALYDIEHENVICLDDNTHACIEDQIDAFLDGLEYAGADVTVNVCYVVVEAAYSEEEVRDAMAAHEYVEVEY